jgi:hypothetical protein
LLLASRLPGGPRLAPKPSVLLAATARSSAGSWQPVGRKPICGDACYDALRRIDHLWDALTVVYGIDATDASKLLARKRPRLCPISDSVGIGEVDVRGRTRNVSR